MRAVQSLFLLLLLLAGTACENGPPWAGGGGGTNDDTTLDFGPVAAYNRRFIFLGPGADLPTAAVFDFVALSDSIGVRRGVRARVVDGTAWHPLLDAGWEMAPMREPWRIVPHGPLTMTVSETGDLGSLVFRDSITARLQLGATLAEQSPDVGTQLVLRSARLSLDGESVPGVVLDTQLGRAVNPELVARAPGADSATADSIASRDPTPIARPGAEALLLDNGGYYVVLANASTGMLAWIRNAGRDDLQDGARLEPTAWSQADDSGVQVPTSWRLVSADGDLSGELTAQSTDRVVLTGTGELQALAYTLVSGWVEDRSVRRDVFGLVRHVR